MKRSTRLPIRIAFAVVAGTIACRAARSSAQPTTLPACCQPALTPAAAMLRAAGITSPTAATQPASAVTTQPATDGMAWIPGGEFDMGAVPGDSAARADESPRHRVRVSGFWMDKTEVTNAQFRAFVQATGYVTTAQRKPDWDELKKQLPPGTPRPPDAVLVPGSLVFVAAPAGSRDFTDWWQWMPGANWEHPSGPTDSIEGKDNYPVVQVSFEDAAAYAKWANKSLPTEAEWEFAARGGQADQRFPWGNDPMPGGKFQANYWQGEFPARNTADDGFTGAAPVGSYAANGYGLFDMMGNVWEWTADWYRADTYQHDAASRAIAVDPTGPASGFDPDEPLVPKKTLRGGSFLCHISYCYSYRSSARMKTSVDSSAVHTGFRCVRRISPTTMP